MWTVQTAKTGHAAAAQQGSSRRQPEAEPRHTAQGVAGRKLTNEQPTDSGPCSGESGQRQGVPGRHTPSPAHTPYTVTDSEGDANTNTRDTLGDCPQTVMKFFFQCVYLSVFYSWCQWR